MNILAWVSMTVAFAILGMGGAPIAEYFHLPWLVVVLKWISWLSVGVLAVATVAVGGIGVHHGVLTLLGKSPGTVREKSAPQSLPSRPRVEAPGAGRRERVAND